MGILDFLGDAGTSISQGVSRGAGIAQNIRRQGRLEEEFERQKAEEDRRRIREEQEQQLRDQQLGIRRGITEGSAELGESRIRSGGPPPDPEDIAPGLERELFQDTRFDRTGRGREERTLAGRGIGLADTRSTDPLTAEPSVMSEFEQIGQQAQVDDVAPEPARAVEFGGDPFAFQDPELAEASFARSPQGQMQGRLDELVTDEAARNPEFATQLELARMSGDPSEVMAVVEEIRASRQPEVDEGFQDRLDDLVARGFPLVRARAIARDPTTYRSVIQEDAAEEEPEISADELRAAGVPEAMIPLAQSDPVLRRKLVGGGAGGGIPTAPGEARTRILAGLPRMEQGLREIESFLARPGPDEQPGTADDELGRVPVERFLGSRTLGRFLQGEDLQSYQAAANRLVGSILRVESGAAIRPEEVRELAEQMVPQPEDKPETVRQKMEVLRETVHRMRELGGLPPEQTGGGSTPAPSPQDTIDLRISELVDEGLSDEEIQQQLRDEGLIE